MRQGCEVAGSADASLLGDEGGDARICEADELVHDAAADAGMAADERVGAEEQGDAGLGHREGTPTPTAWLRRRFAWRSRICASGMRTLERRPKPVFTP